MNLTKIKYFDYYIAFFAYVAIAFVILGGILLSPGTVGFFHDWFIGPYPEMNELWANNGLYKWDSQIGNKVYDTDWILRLIFIPLSFLGGEVLSKGLLILIITLSGFGAFCLGRRLKLGWHLSFAAGILYIFSPIIFTRIAAGYIYYLLAYLLSPFAIERFLKGKEENSYRYFIFSALLVSFSIIQIQFLVLIFLILLLLSLFDIKRIKIGMIGLFLVISITFLITLSPIIISQPFVKNAEIPFIPNQLLSYFTVTTASDLAKSFRILGYEGMPYSYLNLGTSKDILDSNAGIIPPWIFYLDFLIPIVGFSALLVRRDKYTISFSIISVVGLFFLKGLNPPLPGIFTFFFIHGFYIFREVWHIAFLYSISITFLIVFFIQKLLQVNVRSVFKVPLALTLIFMIILSNGYPLLLGNFAGYLQTYDLPSQYHPLYNKLLSNNEYNVLILPYVNPIRYNNLSLQGIDPLVTYSPTMIFPSTLGNRASPTIPASIWLLSLLQENKIDNLGRLFSGFGIKYIVLRNDFVSNYPNYTPLGSLSYFREKWYRSFEPILDSQKDLRIVEQNSQYKLYENLNNAAKIFSLDTSVGGLTNFDSMLLISNQTTISNVALYPSVSDLDSIVFLEDDQERYMPLNDLIEIGQYANTFDANNGWTDNRISFGYDHILADRVKDGLFSASPNSIVSFQLPAMSNDKNVEIWAKILFWSKGGLINTTVNKEKHSLSLFSPDNSFRVVKIFSGSSDKPYDVSFENIHGMNYVEGLYVREKNDFQETPFSNKSLLYITSEQKQPNLVSNFGFSIMKNQSRLPLYWNDPYSSCNYFFTCNNIATEGWNDNQSLQIFTREINERWSSIFGKEIDVNPKEGYELVTHMKLNEWATQSHVAIQGLNAATKRWDIITQCPSGLNGPIDWTTFSCVMTIPENTGKVRVVLNAGWSSEPNKEATTTFDGFSLVKQKNANHSTANNLIQQLNLSKVSQENSSKVMHTMIKQFKKVNPTLWNLYISTSAPTTIGFAEPYDETWQAAIYEAGKKIGTVNSMPLYGTINAFQINQTGDLHIVLTYEAQYWYQIGMMISGFTFGFCILYIIYDWKKSRKLRYSSSAS